MALAYFYAGYGAEIGSYFLAGLAGSGSYLLIMFCSLNFLFI